MAFARLKRWLSTPERKQFVVLLLVAAWISLAALSNHDISTPWSPYVGPPLTNDYLIHIDSPWGDTIQAVWQTISDSIPVVLFGGIFFWWFGKKRRGGEIPPPNAGDDEHARSTVAKDSLLEREALRQKEVTPSLQNAQKASRIVRDVLMQIVLIALVLGVVIWLINVLPR